MPRRRNLDRPTFLNLSLPETLRGQLDLHLYSELEGRVPHGAYSVLIIQLLREYLEGRSLEILPGTFVRGPAEAIAALEKELA